MAVALGLFALVAMDRASGGTGPEEPPDLHDPHDPGHSLDSIIPLLEQEPSYAGIFMEREPRVVMVVMAAGDVDRFKALIDRHVPEGIEFEVRAVTYTHAELAELRDSIDILAWRDRGVLVTSMGVHAPSNRILIRVEDLTPEQEALLLETYGPRIEVTEGERHHTLPGSGGP